MIVVDDSTLLVVRSVPWTLFISMTVSRRNATNVSLQKLWFAVLRRSCKWYGVKWRRVPWVLRVERGVRPDHRHMHAVIRVPLKGRGTVHVFRQAYRSLVDDNHGSVEVRPFKSSTGGALEYILSDKNMSEEWGWVHADLVRVAQATWDWCKRHRPAKPRCGTSCELSALVGP